MESDKYKMIFLKYCVPKYILYKSDMYLIELENINLFFNLTLSQFPSSPPLPPFPLSNNFFFLVPFLASTHKYPSLPTQLLIYNSIKI